MVNTYLYPIYDSESDECSIGTVKARSLEDAYEKLSEVYELDTVCENHFEFQEAMKEYGYVIGLLTDIDEV
jgi:hypothetical protein